jgi:hypothetical protein
MFVFVYFLKNFFIKNICCPADAAEAKVQRQSRHGEGADVQGGAAQDPFPSIGSQTIGKENLGTKRS